MVPPSPRKDASYSLWRTASVKIDKVRRVSLSDWQGDCRAQRQGSVFVARAVVRNLCFLGGSGGLGALSGSGEERGRGEAANSEISKRKKKKRRGAMRTPHLSQPVGCHSKGERSDQTCTRCPVSVIDRNTREMKRKCNIYKSDFKHTFSLLLTSWVTFFSYKCQSNDVGHAGSTIKAFCLCMVKPG